jgi:hypothetical protein
MKEQIAQKLKRSLILMYYTLRSFRFLAVTLNWHQITQRYIVSILISHSNGKKNLAKKKYRIRLPI